MSVQLQDGVEALPLAEARLPRIDRRIATYLATAGRFGVIWLPAYALLTSRAPSLGVAVIVATGLSAIWFLTLTKSFDAARLTLLSLGPSTAAAVGTATGLVLVSTISVRSNIHLGLLELLEVALAVYVFSWAWEAVVHRSVAAERRVLIVGSDGGGAELAEHIAADAAAPFEIAALVGEGAMGNLGTLLEEHRPDIVVLAAHDVPPEAFEQLLDAAGMGFKLVNLPEFYEHAFGRVPIETLRPAWFMNVLHLYQRPYTRVAKRAFDIVVALVGLVVVLWFLPILWILVRRTGGAGPVIFTQTRLGEGGRCFTIYKFRTMRVDAEIAGAVWAAQNDPRITKTGKLMRKTRLDELPQLVNVLKGDMSVVGPRPERPEFLTQLEQAVPFWTRRHLVKPGITGWAQVRRGYAADAEGTADKLSYDLWYLRHRSLVIDLAVCAKTFTTMLMGSGAR